MMGKRGEADDRLTTRLTGTQRLDVCNKEDERSASVIRPLLEVVPHILTQPSTITALGFTRWYMPPNSPSLHPPEGASGKQNK
ncbi:hypothetical protein E2C01_009153 [Portunus trituberculatus]|uniref:Uncharacterized protein n=1 Tax=Portunus trituberculatus TaxID=210409 RepID=A0A5B7D2Q9_PORTR|nr:hypothetical protein [Portunus trituberculatus]